jgi:hypothetical protein
MHAHASLLLFECCFAGGHVKREAHLKRKELQRVKENGAVERARDEADPSLL